MIFETLLGSLGGGILRLTPEIIKVMDAKQARAHELAMTSLSCETTQAKVQNAPAPAQGDPGSKAQTLGPGPKWIDGMSGMVRPIITFAFFGLYASARVGTFLLAMRHGTPALEVLKAIWTPEDQVLLAGMLNFWFLGRVIDKAGR